MESLRESKYLNRTVDTTPLGCKSSDLRTTITLSIQPVLGVRRSSFEIPNFVIKYTSSGCMRTNQKPTRPTKKGHIAPWRTQIRDSLVPKPSDTVNQVEKIKCEKCRHRLKIVEDNYNRSQQPKVQIYDEANGPINLRHLVEDQAESVKSTYQSSVVIPTRRHKDVTSERERKKEKVKQEIVKMEKKMEQRILQMSSAYRMPPPPPDKKYKFSGWNCLKRKDGSDRSHCIQVIAGEMDIQWRFRSDKTIANNISNFFRSTRLAAWREVRFRQESKTLKYNEKSYQEFVNKLSDLLSMGNPRLYLYPSIDAFSRRMKFLSKIQLWSKIIRTETEKRMAIKKRTFPKYKVKRKRLTIRGSFDVASRVKSCRKSMHSDNSDESLFGKGGAIRLEHKVSYRALEDNVVITLNAEVVDEYSGDSESTVSEPELPKTPEPEPPSPEPDVLESAKDEEERMEKERMEKEREDVLQKEKERMKELEAEMRELKSPRVEVLGSPRSPRDKEKSASCCSLL